MTLPALVRAIVHAHPHGVPTFDALVTEVRLHCPDASATEIDAAARPFEIEEPGAYTYQMPARPAEE